MNATSMSIGEQSRDKPLARFGSASIRKPISEGIAKAKTDDARLADSAACDARMIMEMGEAA